MKSHTPGSLPAPQLLVAEGHNWFTSIGVPTRDQRGVLGLVKPQELVMVVTLFMKDPSVPGQSLYNSSVIVYSSGLDGLHVHVIFAPGRWFAEALLMLNPTKEEINKKQKSNRFTIKSTLNACKTTG